MKYEELIEGIVELIESKSYRLYREQKAERIIALIRRSDRQRLKAAIGNLRASAKGNIGCSSGILITLHETHEAIDSVLGGE